MRKYYPIWEKLKQEGEVSITAPRVFHKRIIRMVSKEKYMDLAWKFMLDSDNKPIPRLDYTIESTIIKFRLTSNALLDTL